MAEIYNPSAPSVIGQEWVPIVNDNYTPDFASERGHTFRVPTGLSSTLVTHGRYYVDNPTPGFDHKGQVAGMTVYNKGQECATGPIKKITVPVSVITVDPSPNGTLGLFGGSLLSVIQNPGDDTYFFVNNTSGVGAPASVVITLNFDIASVDTLILNKRILNVSLVSQFTGPFTDNDVAFTSFNVAVANTAGTALTAPYITRLFNVDQSRTANITLQHIDMGEVNTFWNTSYPNVRDNLVALPWTDDDLLRFVDGAASEVNLQITTTVPYQAPRAMTCGYIALEITYCEENRVLVGGVSHYRVNNLATNTVGYIPGSNEVPLYTPQTRIFGASLSANQDYTVTVTMMDHGLEPNQGAFPTLFAARQLYPLTNLNGVVVTKSLTPGDAYTCDTSNLMPQLTLLGNYVRGTDNFNRVVANCWGTASDGVSNYVCGGSGGSVLPTDASVDGTQGIHSVPVALAYRESQMAPEGFGWVDYDATIWFRNTFTDVTGGAIEPGNITVHYDSVLLNSLIFRVTIDLDESIHLQILKDVGGTVARVANNVFPPGTWTANNYWAIRIRAQNQWFGMKIWDTGAVNEPPWWQLIVTDYTFVRDVVSRIGFRSGVANGNTNTKPIIFQYDNASVAVPDVITGVHAYGSQIALPVYDSIEVTQDVRNLSDSSKLYPYVRFYARTFGNTNQPLILTDDSNPSTQVTLSVADFNALPEITDGWKEVNLTFSTPPTFTSSGSLKSFTWSSPGLSVSNQWQILGATAQATYLLDQAKPYPDVVNPTYVQSNGATWLRPHWDTNVERDDSRTDAVLLFSRDTPVVTGFSASEAFIPVDGIGLECGVPPECIPTGIGYNQLTWLPIGSGAVTGIADSQFGYYEIQRKDDVDTTWVTLAQMESRAVTGFADYEARVGFRSDYRMRVCNSMDFCGPWTSIVSSTIATPGIQIGSQDPRVLIFTSNAAQDGSAALAYTPVWADTVDEAFTFPESDTQTLQRMYGKDFFTAFRPLERGGEQFSRTLLIQAAAVPKPILENHAIDIRDLAWADLPYVCVRTEDGDRWFANVMIPSGSVSRRRKLQMVQAQITEVTRTPYIVT
jgi:hypothetical protein